MQHFDPMPIAVFPRRSDLKPALPRRLWQRDVRRRF
jgi:hypothetical protein